MSILNPYELPDVKEQGLREEAWFKELSRKVEYFIRFRDWRHTIQNIHQETIWVNPGVRNETSIQCGNNCVRVDYENLCKLSRLLLEEIETIEKFLGVKKVES